MEYIKKYSFVFLLLIQSFYGMTQPNGDDVDDTRSVQVNLPHAEKVRGEYGIWYKNDIGPEKTLMKLML